VALFLLLLSVFRLIYASYLGLAEDEAYYWQWSRHPDLAYFDQGPGIAWVIRAGTSVLGHTPLGVRLIVVLLSTLSAWFTFLTARHWLGERAALWSVGLVSVAPLLAAGSVLATYDAPQVFCWTLALVSVFASAA
jgi:dolichol-phosphate mannosyltransferase